MLNKLGKVLHMTRNGYVVAVLEARDRLPPLNTPVYDEKTNRVGILLDIIGPVKAPYAVVKPDRKGLEIPPGTMLYYRPPRPPRRRRGIRRGARGRGGAPRERRKRRP